MSTLFRQPSVAAIAGTSEPFVTAVAQSGASIVRAIARHIVQPAGHGLARLLGTASAAAQSRADEAADVRALAWRVRHSDPGFSADLYAAAARHEAE